MGMSLRSLNELIGIRYSGRLENLTSVCDIGATQLDLKGHAASMRAFLEAYGCQSLPADEDIEQWSEGGHAEKLWRACNLEYTAVDVSTEIETLNLDLNFDAVPPEHLGRYQLVLNFGTTEHVCNQLHAMRVIHDLCAPGGLIYHVVPFSGYQNHGFFRYNAKFFWSLCRSNDYGYHDLYVDLADSPEPIHPDIATNMGRFGHGLYRVSHFSTIEGVLRVLMQKQSATHFRPPFDGIIGNVPNQIPVRYHEVFRELAEAGEERSPEASESTEDQPAETVATEDAPADNVPSLTSDYPAPLDAPPDDSQSEPVAIHANSSAACPT